MYGCIWSRGEFLCRRDGSPFSGGCRLAVCGKENVATGDIGGSILIPATVPFSLIGLSISISDSQLVLGEEYKGDIGAIVASGDGMSLLIRLLLLLDVTIEETVIEGAEDSPVMQCELCPGAVFSLGKVSND